MVRRAGFWAVGLAAVVLAFAYGIPAIAAALAPSQSEVIAALVGAMAAETRVPAITLGALGLAGIVLSLFWRAAPALLADPAPPRRARREPRLVGGPPPRRDIPRPAPAELPLRPTRRSGARRTPPPPPCSPAPVVTTPNWTRIRRTSRRRIASRTGRWRKRRSDDAAGRPAATAGADALGVAGTGWVVESAEHIPPEARWVPGVGYVVEEG